MSIRFPGLGLSLDYVERSVRIFGFDLPVYGILIAAALLVGLGVLVMEAGRAGENQDHCLGMAITALIVGIIGGRAFYVAFSWSLYQDHVMEIFNLPAGGMSVYGVILGAMAGIALYCRLNKLSFSEMADMAFLGFLPGEAVAAWGAFFNRETFGEYTDSFLAMELPLSAVRSAEVTATMRDHLVEAGGISYIRVQPLFLYESVLCLVLFCLLLVLNRRKKFQGEVFMDGLAGYGLAHFFMEGSRTDALLIPGTQIHAGQIVCVLLVVICGCGSLISRAMEKKRQELRKKREALLEAQEQVKEETEAEPEPVTAAPEPEKEPETPVQVEAAPAPAVEEKEKETETTSFFAEELPEGTLPVPPDLAGAVEVEPAETEKTEETVETSEKNE